MPVLVALLRGINIGPHKRMKMDVLKGVCESLKFTNVQTLVQSGNVVFKTKETDELLVARKLEKAIEKKFGFTCDVVVRSAADLKSVIQRTPFAKRDLHPGKILVVFLRSDPTTEAREKASQIKAAPEELYLDGREFYMYFPNGMARPQLNWGSVEKALKTPATGRNWNTVTKLLEIAESLE
jgi:uncharacterized protein (DUF1697 family)